MRGFVLGLSLSVAFIAGSLFGSLGESTADAQQGRQRWEYKCEHAEGARWSAIDRSRTEILGRLGPRGWELATYGGGTGTMCFKRPL